MNVEFYILFSLLLPIMFVSKVGVSHSIFFKNKNISNSWSISLSAVATNHSAFVYLGQIGFTYTYGLESLWLILGWKLGDWFSMLFLQHKIKIIIDKNNIFSLSELINVNSRFEYSSFQLFFGGITIFGLSLYGSAQLIALDKVLTFYQIEDGFFAILFISFVIVCYLSRGGFKASIKTDTAQALIIFLSISVLLYFGIQEIGGTSYFIRSIFEYKLLINVPKSPFDLGSNTALILFLIGWFFAGAGTIAQPHMLMRFMAARNRLLLRSVQLKYVVISSIFSIPILGLAFVARELIPFGQLADPELALLVIAQDFFPYFLVLILVYGIMAAAMSTLDSIVLAISTIITKDILPSFTNKAIAPRQSIVFAMLGILILWLTSTVGVFTTVISSWSLVAGLYLPIITLLILKVRAQSFDLFIGAVFSIITQYLWWINDLNSITYSLLPASIVFIVLTITCKKIRRAKKRKINA